MASMGRGAKEQIRIAAFIARRDVGTWSWSSQNLIVYRDDRPLARASLLAGLMFEFAYV